MEIWAEIRGYENHYEVSNLGRVRSIKSKPKILSQMLGKCPYYTVGLSLKGKVKVKYVHRLVAEAFIPVRESRDQVNHIDGIKTNNNLSNLEWVTRSENSHHALKLGLLKINEKHPHTKITKEDVLFIRSNPYKLTQNQLASMFNMSRTGISSIVNRKSWKNV